METMNKLAKFITLSLLALVANVATAHLSWHQQLSGAQAAKELMSSLNLKHQVPIAIFDVSFYGHEKLLADHLAFDYVVTATPIFSPHGSAVASLIVDSEYGATEQAQISLLNTGIFTDNFEHGIEVLAQKDIRLVNASMGLRSAENSDLINDAAKRLKSIFVISAGNAGVLKGKELAPHYHGLQAIIVSCVDEDGTIPDFAQIDTPVTVLAPCGNENIPSQRLTYDSLNAANNGIWLPYAFGMTSAGAPQVTAALVDALALKPDLTLDEAQTLLRQSATRFVEYEGVKYPVLNHLGLVEELISRRP